MKTQDLRPKRIRYCVSVERGSHSFPYLIVNYVVVTLVDATPIWSNLEGGANALDIWESIYQWTEWPSSETLFGAIEIDWRTISEY